MLAPPSPLILLGPRYKAINNSLKMKCKISPFIVLTVNAHTGILSPRLCSNGCWARVGRQALLRSCTLLGPREPGIRSGPSLSRANLYKQDTHPIILCSALFSLLLQDREHFCLSVWLGVWESKLKTILHSAYMMLESREQWLNLRKTNF